jgi:dTDP-3-amino-3,4,6-trideoxy-alpha-D-glucose transaminase
MESTLLTDKVPFLDLGRVHAELREDIVAAIAGVIDSGGFGTGPEVQAFEESFAAFVGSNHCIGVSSGLDALVLGLLAAGLEPGDEVIAPAGTFVATIEAVVHAGGIPVLVDVAEQDYCMDVSAAESVVTGRTRFVLPVHLYGQMSDMRKLLAMANGHGLHVLEDACQAHGAERDGVRAGHGGLAGAFSFYPGKNLGAMGDAGALVTDDAGLAARVASLREHGQRGKYRHELIGYTARLDAIQAIVLLHKLPHLERWNGQRVAAAAFYSEALDGVGDLQRPPVPDGSDPVWHLYVVRTARPTELADFLRRRGIVTGRHYPDPVHLTPAFAELGYRSGSFPVSEALAREGLSLPIFPGITEPELEAVVDAIASFFAHA